MYNNIILLYSSLKKYKNIKYVVSFFNSSTNQYLLCIYFSIYRLLDIEQNPDNAVQLRNIRKLEKYRKKFLAMKEIKSAPWGKF